MESRWKGDDSEHDKVKLEEVVLKRVGEYKYLGSVVQEDGELKGRSVGRYRWDGVSSER